MRRIALLAVVWVTGCGVQGSTISGELGELRDGAESALTTDLADHGCQVVLRQVERAPSASGGYETKCDAQGSCFYVWHGSVDVAAAAATSDAQVWVQYHSIDDTVWHKQRATATAGAAPGFKRFAFRLESFTLSPGMSATSWQRAQLFLIPYLMTTTSRLFDHNRVQGALDAYSLAVNNQWSINDDATVCQPQHQSRGTVSFLGDFTTVQRGALVAGGTGIIDYDIARLANCRGTHDGYPAWDVRAIATFTPGGQQVDGTVKLVEAPYGVPTGPIHSQPFEFKIPSGATGAQVYFVNTGLGCQPTYDSNFGSNYHLEVEPAPFAAVGWVGNARASTSRACVADREVPEPMVLDEYMRERACSFVELEAWVPGLTDAAVQKPQALLARATLSLDGVALPAVWLSFQGRVGNNYRERFEVPRDTLYYGQKWSNLTYTLEFSTDGVVWVQDVARTVHRDVSWCNPAWGSCQ